MRGEHHVRRVTQRVVGRHRLGGVDVDGGTTQVTRVERIGQRRLVDDAAASHVEDERARLGRLQLRLTDEAARLRGERSVDGDDVGAVQQLREADQLGAELGSLVLGHVRVVGEDAHLETRGTTRDRASDLAEADDAERLAAQLMAGVATALPLAGAYRGVRLRHVAQRATA